MKKIILCLVAIFSLVGCTAQQRAKKYGGSATVNLPENTKLVTVTWKETDLWLLYRQRKPNEVAESYKFQESSSWGVFEGTITINEK